MITIRKVGPVSGKTLLKLSDLVTNVPTLLNARKTNPYRKISAYGTVRPRPDRGRV